MTVLLVWQLRDCLDDAAMPMDGETLTSALHQRGVNVRYLGSVLRELDKMEEKGRLCHLQVRYAATINIKMNINSDSLILLKHPEFKRMKLFSGD